MPTHALQFNLGDARDYIAIAHRIDRISHVYVHPHATVVEANVRANEQTGTRHFTVAAVLQHGGT